MKRKGNLHILDNPLLVSKVTQLRRIETKPAQFRRLVADIARIEVYEALNSFPMKEIEIVTPMMKALQKTIDEEKICLVPILRAGLGMSDGAKEVLPGSPVGMIGLYRDEKTHEAHEYYSRFPKNIDEMDVLLLDPMLATGGSALDAVKMLRAHGAKKIHFLAIIAAPEGVKRFTEAEPDIPLYVAALDDRLNENAYILPGLGDAGDRIFGTLD